MPANVTELDRLQYYRDLVEEHRQNHQIVNMFQAIAPGEASRTFSSPDLARIDERARYRLERLWGNPIRLVLHLLQSTSDGRINLENSQMVALIELPELSPPPSSREIEIHEMRIRRFLDNPSVGDKVLPKIVVPRLRVDYIEPARTELVPRVIDNGTRDGLHYSVARHIPQDIRRCKPLIGEASRAAIREALNVFNTEWYSAEAPQEYPADMQFEFLNLEEVIAWFGADVKFTQANDENWELLSSAPNILARRGFGSIKTFVYDLNRCQGLPGLNALYDLVGGEIDRYTIYQD